jgi:release factor glutamine methyltransferase
VAKGFDVDGFEARRLEGARKPATPEQAFVRLGEALVAADYNFVTVTPETHRRVTARPENSEARSLRDVFGWSRPFRRELLGEPLMSLLETAGAVETRADGLLASSVRFSTYREHIFLHSAYPTAAGDSVFFGPDTYRFLAFIERELALLPALPRRILDIGTGSGAGGIVAARRLGAETLLLSDINERALLYARVNAALNNVAQASVCRSDVTKQIDGTFDLVLSNPPYLVDAGARLYRNGGGALGADLSLRILREGLERLAPGGRLLLYTGSAIVEGEDRFRVGAEAVLRKAGCAYRYEEIDPDVFGEELETGPYRAAERIAVVGLVAAR